MTIPLQLTYRGVPPSPALEALVHERTRRLELLSERITSCHVIIERPARQHGAAYAVRLHVALPGARIDIATERKHADDAYVAARNAFERAERRLEALIRVGRSNVKAHEPPAQGPIGEHHIVE